MIGPNRDGRHSFWQRLRTRHPGTPEPFPLLVRPLAELLISTRHRSPTGNMNAGSRLRMSGHTGKCLAKIQWFHLLYRCMAKRVTRRFHEGLADSWTEAQSRPRRTRVRGMDEAEPATSQVTFIENALVLRDRIGERWPRIKEKMWQTNWHSCE